MVRVKPLLTAVGLVGAGVAAGVLLLESPAPAANSDRVAVDDPAPAAAEDPAAILRVAQENAPYAIRLPTWIPAGYELKRVSFDSDPTAPGRHAFTIDLKYVNAKSEVVHIWQSNATADRLGSTDPLTIPGSTVLEIGSQRWVATELAELEGVGRTELAYRDHEGIIMTVDGPDLPDLIRVVESLAATP